MIKLTIIGIGGVGGYFGARLLQARNPNLQVTFVARGAHFRQLHEKGLEFKSGESTGELLRPHFLVSEIEEANISDIVLICVKDYDLSPVMSQMKSMLHSTSVIIPLMNGVDIYERVKKHFPENTVLPSCVYVASHIKSPGVVEHKGNAGVIYSGPDPAEHAADYNWISAIFNTAGIRFDFGDNVFDEIRRKFLFIAGFGLITALHNKSIGEILADDGLRKEAELLLEEYARVLYDPHQIEASIETALRRAETFPFDTKTSLQLDIHSSKSPDRNELDLYVRPLFNGKRQPSGFVSRITKDIREQSRKNTVQPTVKK